jgi:hypothetical protein
MDGENVEPLAKSSWSKRALQLVAFVVALAVAKMITAGISELWSYKSDGALKKDFDQHIGDSKEMGPVFAELKTDFPSEYEHFVQNYISLVRGQSTKLQAKSSSTQMMQQIVTRHMGDIIRAPAPVLIELISTQTKLAAEMQKSDLEMCAAFGFGGNSSSSTPTTPTMNLLGKNSLLELKAAHLGAQNPVSRAKPSEDDYMQLVQQMKMQGLTRENIQILDDSRAQAEATVDDKCKVTVALYKSLSALPEGTRIKIWAAMNSAAAADARQKQF